MAVTFLTNEDRTALEEQISKIKAEVITDQNCHADYFDIADDGELSIKVGYDESIPANLVIPEVVNEITVVRLSSGMFKKNEQIESVTFPDTIEEIPDECFNEAVNLRNLYNAEHIKKIGAQAFRFTRLEKAVFPNLEEFTGGSAFTNVPHLAYADVGKVTTIPDKTFKFCYYLSKVVGENVTTVGSEAFMGTTSLVIADFVGNLTSIGNYAFWATKFEYNGSGVSDLSASATYAQINPTDFWSSLTPTPCENPTPTEFCQYDKRWVNVSYGASGRTYQSGCVQFCALHIYSGLKKRPFNTVFDFEDIIKTFETPENPLLSIQNGGMSKVKALLDGVGLTTEHYSSWNAETLTSLYNTLNNGGYAIACIGSTSAHAVVIYGVNENGELLVLDSERKYPYDTTKAKRYKLPFNKFICHTNEFLLVNN